MSTSIVESKWRAGKSSRDPQPTRTGWCDALRQRQNEHLEQTDRSRGWTIRACRAANLNWPKQASLESPSSNKCWRYCCVCAAALGTADYTLQLSAVFGGMRPWESMVTHCGGACFLSNKARKGSVGSHLCDCM